MYVLYTDELILEGTNKDEVDQAIKDIQNKKLNITIEGYIQDLLGINIDSMQDGSFHLMRHHLICQILKDIKMRETMRPKSTSTLCYLLL